MAKRGKMSNQQSKGNHHKLSTNGQANVKARTSSSPFSETVGPTTAINLLALLAATGTRILYLGGPALDPVVFPALLAGPDENGSFI